MIKTTAQVGSYEYETQEDRSAPRTRVIIPAYLRPASGKRLVTNTRDISLSGFSAIVIARVGLGTTCWLTLPDTAAFEAETVWWEGGVLGCAFKQLLEPAVLASLLQRWS